MTGRYWILDRDGRPVEVDDVLTWGQWFETADRHVARDADELRGWLVSTVFLGLDHNYSGSGPPLLYETLVFDGPLDGEMRRYATREEAEAGHREICARLDTIIAAGDW